MSGRKKAPSIFANVDGCEYIASSNDVEVTVIRSADAKTGKITIPLSSTLNGLKDAIHSDRTLGPLRRDQQRLFHLGRELKSGNRSLSALGIGKHGIFSIHLHSLKPKTVVDLELSSEEADDDDDVDDDDENNAKKSNNNNNNNNNAHPGRRGAREKKSANANNANANNANAGRNRDGNGDDGDGGVVIDLASSSEASRSGVVVGGGNDRSRNPNGRRRQQQQRHQQQPTHEQQQQQRREEEQRKVVELLDSDTDDEIEIIENGPKRRRRN